MERLKLIVNPTSGKEQALDWLADVNALLRRRFTIVDAALTVAEGDHEREAARAIDDGYTHLVAVGGDGTLNGVLNSVGRRPGGFEAVTLGVIPAGTGNDFARALGIPEAPADAAAAIVEGRIRQVDVGVVNDRCFFNTSAGGFIAETSVRVDSSLKTLAGRFAYLLGGAQALLDHEPVAVTLRGPGMAETRMPMQTFVVSNAPYMGGGYRIAPGARVDDGLLDVCVLHAASVLDFVAALRRFAQGERLETAEATYLRVARLDVETDGPVWVNTDGEPYEGRRFSYRVLPGAARIMG
jgi:diacylglycerol kinase (ATP)